MFRLGKSLFQKAITKAHVCSKQIEAPLLKRSLFTMMKTSPNFSSTTTPLISSSSSITKSSLINQKVWNRIYNLKGFPKQQTRSMANHRHKKYIKLAKGYRGRTNIISVAYRRVQKARQYAYRDRKVKKRDFRKLWIQRINAGSRIYGIPYSKLTNNLLRSDIKLNRKVLSDLAMTEPLSFRSIVEVAKLN